MEESKIRVQRDKVMDVLLALGIIYVVLGHSYQPATIPLRAYSFHMALFFFISGCFFKPKYTIEDKFSWMKKKTIRLIVPYYILNILFALVTAWLKTRGIQLGQGLNIYTFLIWPFLHGHQYHLFAPAWFIIQLYLVHLSYQLIYLKNLRYYPCVITASLMILSLFLVIQTGTGMNSCKRIITRTCFGTAFYSLGFLYYSHKTTIDKYLINPNTFLVALILRTIIDSAWEPLSYELVWARFTSPSPLAPFISSILAIIILINLAHGFCKIYPGENIIYRIGRNTFAIMCFHLSVFFIVNCLLCAFGLVKYKDLSSIGYHWNVEYFWFIYILPAILIPTYLSELFRKMLPRLHNRIAHKREIAA